MKQGGGCQICRLFSFEEESVQLLKMRALSKKEI